MVVTRVLLASDSHLSLRTPEAVANWGAVVRHIEATRPDLVIHIGDVVRDGIGVIGDGLDDLDLARRELGRCAVPVHAIPGNHDVGDSPQPGDDPQSGGEPGHAGKGLVSAAHLARFRDALGPDRWSIDVPGWRLIGLNVLLFGSGLDEEAEQWRWLAEVAEVAEVGEAAEVAEFPGVPGVPGVAQTRAPARRIALFVHKPLLPGPVVPDDTNPGRYVLDPARTRLLQLIDDAPVGLVVSGHVHQFGQHRRGHVTRVWVPSTWAVIPERFQPVLGEKVCGVVELSLFDAGDPDGGGSSRAELRQPEGLLHQAILDTIPDPYAPLR